MSKALLIRLQEGKIRVLEEAIETWKRDHEDALLGYDVEELIAECLSCWEDMRHAWVRTRRLAILNRLEDLQGVGTGVLDHLSRFLGLLDDVAALAENVSRETGHPIEGRVSLHEAIREGRDLREHVKKSWPWDSRPTLPLNRKMVEESRAGRARGESQEVAGLLANLGVSVPLRQE